MAVENKTTTTKNTRARGSSKVTKPVEELIAEEPIVEEVEEVEASSEQSFEVIEELVEEVEEEPVSKAGVLLDLGSIQSFANIKMIMEITGKSEEEVLEAKATVRSGIENQYSNMILAEPGKADMHRQELQFILKVRGL